VLLFAAVSAIEESDTVTELENEKRLPTMTNGGGEQATGKELTHPANADGAGGPEGTGYFRDIPNAPGPRHGLPGYKESHDWETDVDFFSPLVFDWRFYAAKNLQGTEDEMASKKDWLTNVIDRVDGNGKADPLKVPNCKQATPSFGANEYHEANKGKTDIDLLAGNCKDLIAHYQKTGIFAAYPTVKNPAKYDSVSVSLLTPIMGRGSDQSPVFQAGKGTHFEGLAIGMAVNPNSFVAARHNMLNYWMRVKASQELPLGEYMGYGGKRADSYFRSGFGCLDANFEKCFFIFAFGAASGEEYFHSFNDENFETKQLAFAGGAWGHIGMILSTAKPDECPGNTMGASEDACKGMLEVFINGKELKLVDWNHGESTENAKQFTRGPVEPIWNTIETNDGAAGTVLRRFFLSPPKECAIDGSCGGITNNNYKIGFPWPDPWTDNLFICDMSQMPSNTGGFGDAAKRKLMAEAVYNSAKARVATSCGE
jgi:hypothetical protein